MKDRHYLFHGIAKNQDYFPEPNHVTLEVMGRSTHCFSTRYGKQKTEVSHTPTKDRVVAGIINRYL